METGQKYGVYRHIDRDGEVFYIGSGKYALTEDGSIKLNQSRGHCNIGRNDDWWDRVIDEDGLISFKCDWFITDLTKEMSLIAETAAIAAVGPENLTNKVKRPTKLSR